jgi:hypothetical protein
VRSIETKHFPPVELAASQAALVAADEGLASYAAEAIAGHLWQVWLADAAGRLWCVGSVPRDLQFMFEVFSLSIHPAEELDEMARARGWPPVQRPAKLVPWPLGPSTLHVLRRTEFIAPADPAQHTFGVDPLSQSAARPGCVPPDASAACDVAVGLLFANEYDRLLLAADWNPMRLILTQEHEPIEDYLATCESVPLAEYLERLG